MTRFFPPIPVAAERVPPPPIVRRTPLLPKLIPRTPLLPGSVPAAPGTRIARTPLAKLEPMPPIDRGLTRRTCMTRPHPEASPPPGHPSGPIKSRRS